MNSKRKKESKLNLVNVFVIFRNYREGVKIHGVGFFLCMFIPTAFVEISPDQLLKISIWKRLKIISAGIWHNYVLGAVCALLLLINPLLLSPFYIQNQGVVVSYVDRVSFILSSVFFSFFISSNKFNVFFVVHKK